MFIIIAFFIILSIILIGLFVFLICRNIDKKYNNYVLQNSVCIEKLKDINSHYAFNVSKSFDQSHTYDNEIFFNNISCTDYLIYQLQFIKYDIFKQIKAINANKQMYSRYINEVNSITEYGNFKCSTGKLKIEKLLKIEKEVFKKTVLNSPQTLFFINIILYQSDINGKVYNKKYKRFDEEEVTNLIKRINNKHGNFYNDRSVWDAICRVERGKVSNKMRFSIYARDGYRCRICGIKQQYADLEIDHIIPIAKGGKSTYNNLQTLCHNCNVQKGDSV